MLVYVELEVVSMKHEKQPRTGSHLSPRQLCREVFSHALAIHIHSKENHALVHHVA